MAVIVNIPDDNFHRCLNRYLGQSAGAPITDVQLQALTGSINASEQGIADITGAEYLTSISMFEGSYNQITGITPLSGLTQLIDLRLTGNKISSLSSLAQLVNLTWLEAGNNDISGSLSELSAMTKLTFLDLRQNYISSIENLSGLVNLTYLAINSNHLKEIAACRYLINLEQLEADVNQLSDFTPLAPLVNLKSLTISGQKIHPAAVDNTGAVAAPDPVINVDGSVIPAVNISNGGTYADGVVTWTDLPPDLTQVTYQIAQTIYAGQASALLNADVYQNLTVV